MKAVSILSSAARIALGTILLIAGVGKLVNFNSLLNQVALYGLLPMRLVPAASYALVSAEVILGTLLILGYLCRSATLLVGCLLLSFTLAMSSVLWRKLPLEECGCGNALANLLGLGHSLSWKNVALNVGMRSVAFTLACATIPGRSMIMTTILTTT